jgi:hypothetical protein
MAEEHKRQENQFFKKTIMFYEFRRLRWEIHIRRR